MASVETYTDDGGKVAAGWLLNAQHEIDTAFGAGHAKANPQLVAAMVQASALHFHASWLGKALGEHGLDLGR